MAKLKETIPAHVTSVGLLAENRKITVRIDRARLKIDKADELFAGRRLTGVVAAILEGEDLGQEPLIKDALPSVDASFDVKGFNVKPDFYSCGLIFAKDDVSPDTLDRFLNRSIKIAVTAHDDIPEPEKDEE